MKVFYLNRGENGSVKTEIVIVASMCCLLMLLEVKDVLGCR